MSRPTHWWLRGILIGILASSFDASVQAGTAYRGRRHADAILSQIPSLPAPPPAPPTILEQEDGPLIRVGPPPPP